ncbi:MAG: tRNA (adenosine(37)-N6)-threonylcarbamoyltransferase complex transferase subunit TsaD [Candidatus Pacebacteria bacterium]|nr:tRNA (adenosine(37)-N6)-threonylcarbamoyltransferase complex transferase subunit TsaD [Candidatus Paceibacterota bacterium]
MKNSSKKILAIETSCDETSIALLEFSGDFPNNDVAVHSHIIASQAALHAQYGGVYPDLAKKEHTKSLPIVLEQSLKESGLFIAKTSSQILQNLRMKILRFRLKKLFQREPAMFEKTWEIISSIEKPDIDAVMVTYGPGLTPALWTGINFARGLSLAWNIPIIPTHHMKGHIWSIFATGRNFKLYRPSFPLLVLLVSGGHTQLVLVRDFDDYELLGETLDDAVGEAFDKVARDLNLTYPGGPHIEKIAAEHVFDEKSETIKLPRPMIATEDYNFSFSGLKTAVHYLVRDLEKTHGSIFENKPLLAHIAYEFQSAVTDVLVKKTARAIKNYQPTELIIAGGVSANKHIAKAFHNLGVEHNIPITLPPRELTGDNALMIGIAGWIEMTAEKKKYNTSTIRAHGRLPY